MPNYQVVRCAEDKCTRFQTQQEKKAKKWTCVVCGLKQSIKRVYFESTASKDCRSVVMEMNMKSGQASQTRQQLISSFPPPAVNAQAVLVQKHIPEPRISKWSQYMDDANEAEEAVPEDQQLDKSGRITLGPVPSKEVKNRQLTVSKRTAAVSNAKPVKAVRNTPYQRPAASNSTTTSLSQALTNLRQKQQSALTPTAPGVIPALVQRPAPAQAKPTPTAAHEPSRWDQYVSDSDSESDSE